MWGSMTLVCTVLDLSRRPEDLQAWRLAAFIVDKKLLLACASALVVSNHEELLLGRGELPLMWQWSQLMSLAGQCLLRGLLVAGPCSLLPHPDTHLAYTS